MGVTDELHTAEDLDELREENAAEAIEGITPDWFDYLRQERNDFVTKFWQMYVDFEIGAKEQVMAENILIAFDQMYEACAMIYFHKRREYEPNAEVEDLIEMTVLAVFGEFKQPEIVNGITRQMKP